MGLRGNVRKIALGQDALIQKVDKIMALVDDLQKALQAVDDATTQVANEIKSLTDQLKNQSLSESERAAVFARFDKLTADLTAMGKPPQPVPPAPPTPVQGRKKT